MDPELDTGFNNDTGGGGGSYWDPEHQNQPQAAAPAFSAPTTTQQAAPDWQGALPDGYSRAQVNDFLSRNPGNNGVGYDTSRIFSALTQPKTNTMSSYGGSSAPFSGAWDKTFTAPDPNDILNSPLVQARLRLGQNAIERGAASHGTVLTPGVQKSIAAYAGDVGSSEYWNLYGAAKGEFDTAYNQFEGDNSRLFSNYATTRGLDMQQQGLDNNILNSDRNFGLNQQAQDFSQYNTMDTNFYDRLFAAARLGLPQ